MDNDDEIKTTIVEINAEISKIAVIMNTPEKNKDVFLKKLKNSLLFIKWVSTSWNIRYNKPGPSVFKQKEIFYCELGNNIGSEQNGNRPVIIMQNNIANSSGNTTIIVPIISYDNSIFYEKDGSRYISFIKNGVKIEKKLDFYEIQICITSDSNYNIYGVANVAHIREVSKKRLSNTPVAKITDDTYNDIVKAIDFNLRIC